MELRSSRVLKKTDSLDEKRLSLSSDKSQKGASEIETRVSDENANEDLESDSINGRKSENTDDKCVFLGSEVLDPIKDSAVPCPEGEIEECSERNRSSSMNVSDTDTDIKEDIKSSDKDIVKRKRGRKRKNIESLECNGAAGAKRSGIPASERVLRSRDMTGSGGRKRIAGTEIEPDSGRPKKKLKRRGRPPKISGEALPENSPQVAGKRKKKLKRRGRPPKVKTETSPENTQLSDIPAKIQRGRGRPRKVPFERIEKRGRPRKDVLLAKLKRRGRGRPPKTHVIKMQTVKLMSVKNRENQFKGKTVKTHRKLPKVTGVDQADASGTSASDPREKQSAGGGRPERQLVRDRILRILMNAGWTVDRRSRPDRAYKDAVYIDPNGRGHWSITKAYNMLKKKIEDGEADDNEVAAFIPIPDNEFSMLFRFSTKVRSDKKNQVKPVKKKIKQKRDNSQDEKRKKRRKPCLLARSSERGSDQDNDKGSIYNKKRNLFAWMVDSGVVMLGSKVQYGKTRRKKRPLEGTVSDDGVCCGCCGEVMGLPEFATHAGGKLRHPFDSVFLESGKPLRQCLVESWRKEEASNTIGFNLVDVKGDDPNDDTCNICGDGGNLVCCDSCPSTFHESCLDIQNFPSGDWNCIYCSCKFCGVVVSVGDSQTDHCHHAKMLSCCLCEEKFHEACLQEAETVNIDSGKQTFCGRKCKELFEGLQADLGVKYELDEGFSWTLLQCSEVGEDSDLSLHDTQMKVERNSKLAVTFSVMDECFVPIVDERSGTDIIHNVVFNCGSNIRRLNYATFFSAVLEKGDELVSAASIRIHGHRLAEMPFVGTRHMYRRQGMCRRLLDALESRLSSLGVEELVIPAIPELLETWTKAFGFMPVDVSMKQAMKSMSMLVFPGIDMLRKPLFRNQSTDPRPCPLSASDGKNVTKFENVPSNVIGCKETEDAAVLTDGNGLCDLNFPVVVSAGKAETPANRSPEIQLGEENDDGVVEVKASEKVEVPKNTFDLNLHPNVVDTDMHIVVDDFPPTEPQMCAKPFDLSDSKPLVLL